MIEHDIKVRPGQLVVIDVAGPSRVAFRPQDVEAERTESRFTLTQDGEAVDPDRLRAELFPRIRAMYQRMAAAEQVDPKRMVEEGYDRIDERRWDELESEAHAEVRARYTSVLFDRLPANAKVLDLGCGSGVPTSRQLARRFRVTGVDLSARRIALARQNVQGARFIRADMTQLDLPAESDDAIVAFYSIIHVPREEQPELLRRIASWLRPGGLLVATMSVHGTKGDVDDFFGVPMYWSGFDATTNQRLIEEAGLEILTARQETVEEQGEKVAFLWVVAQKPAQGKATGAKPRDAEVLRSLGLDPAETTVHLMQERHGSHLYRVWTGAQSYVLKWFGDAEQSIEVRSYALLQGLGVPTLPVYGQTEHALLLEDLETSPTWRLAREADVDREETGVAVAHWYRALHAAGERLLAGPEGIPPFLTREVDALNPETILEIGQKLDLAHDPVWALAAETIEALKGAMRALPETLNYNDFYWSNLALSRETEPALRAIVFDYHLLGIGLRYSDCRNVAGSLGERAAAAFWGAYGAVDERERVLDGPASMLYGLLVAVRRPQFPRWAEGLVDAVRSGELERTLARVCRCSVGPSGVRGRRGLSGYSSCNPRRGGS